MLFYLYNFQGLKPQNHQELIAKISDVYPTVNFNKTKLGTNFFYIIISFFSRSSRAHLKRYNYECCEKKIYFRAPRAHLRRYDYECCEKTFYFFSFCLSWFYFNLIFLQLKRKFRLHYCRFSTKQRTSGSFTQLDSLKCGTEYASATYLPLRYGQYTLIVCALVR